MTLRTVIEQYIAWKQAQGAHFESPAYVLRRSSRFMGEGTGSDEVCADQADGFLGGRSPVTSSRAYKYSVLTGLYRYAIARGIATRSPLPPEAPKSPPPALPYIYPRDELRRLLDATETSRKRVNQLEPHTFRAFLLLLYSTGLRRGEALRLTIGDVDLRAALLVVRNTKFGKSVGWSVDSAFVPPTLGPAVKATPFCLPPTCPESPAAEARNRCPRAAHPIRSRKGDFP